MNLKFEGGINIALKIPQRKYDETVAFYRDVVGMQVEEKTIDNPTITRTCKVIFGANILWLDCCPFNSHSETWLEMNTNDVERATEHLATHGIQPCDELERIPKDSHWITDPAGNVFILQKS